MKKQNQFEKQDQFGTMQTMPKSEMTRTSGGWAAWLGFAAYAFGWAAGTYCGHNYGEHPTLCFENGGIGG